MDRLWQVLKNRTLSLFLFYSLSLCFIFGSFVAEKRPAIFLLLKYMSLHEWLISYGIKDISYTFWFILAVFLLFLLGITTLVCGISEIKSSLSMGLFHIGFVLILLGILINHTCSSIYFGNILSQEKEIVIPEKDIVIRAKKIKIDFFPKQTHYLGMSEKVSDCSAVLLIEGKTKKISLNKPCFYKGFFIFIEDFGPKYKTSKKRPYLNLTIKKEKGIVLLLIGSFMFFIGIAGVFRRWQKG